MGKEYAIKISLVIILLIILLVLTGCESEEIKGKIIDKKYCESMTMQQIMWVGKTFIMIPITYPEEYKIQIEKANRRNDLGKCFKARV